MLTESQVFAQKKGGQSRSSSHSTGMAKKYTTLYTAPVGNQKPDRTPNFLARFFKTRERVKTSVTVNPPTPKNCVKTTQVRTKSRSQVPEKPKGKKPAAKAKSSAPPRKPAGSTPKLESGASKKPRESGDTSGSDPTPMGIRIAAEALKNTLSYKYRLKYNPSTKKVEPMYAERDARAEGEPMRKKQPDRKAGWHGCMRGVREAIDRATGLGNEMRAQSAMGGLSTLPRAGFKKIKGNKNPLLDPIGTIHIYAMDHIDITGVADDGTPLLISDFQSRFAPTSKILGTFAPPDYVR